MAQTQAVLALAEKHPDQFNMQSVIARLLKQMKVPNINDLMVNTPAPEQRTSADENAALLIGQPAYAYVQQDHISHIQDHLQFAMNPFMGQSPFADPGYLNNLIEHLKQHMTLWYTNRSNGYVEAKAKKQLDNYDDPNYTPVIDQLYTVVGAHVMMDANEVFSQFMPDFEKIMQIAQQRQNQPPQLPPDAQVVKDTSMAETQRKTQKDQADVQIAQAKMQTEMQRAQLEAQARVQIENAKLTHQTIQNLAPQPQPPAPQLPQPPQGVPNGNI
jgi:hypothetical protein